jgi:phosphohistidine phosphatase
MLLHLVRHGDAGDPAAWNGPDAARPLSDKGRGQAERLGVFLADHDVKMDAVITSPKLRAVQTAEIVAGHLGASVTTDDRLGDALDLATLDAVLTDAGDPDRAILFGHDPDFSEFVAELCSASNVPMRKGALAKIEVDRPLQTAGGTLRWLIPPDALRRKG